MIIILFYGYKINYTYIIYPIGVNIVTYYISSMFSESTLLRVIPHLTRYISNKIYRIIMHYYNIFFKRHSYVSHLKCDILVITV